MRNPYGIGFHPDGRLFVTEHGSDERGARWIVGGLDDFYEIRGGAWYGWPDFASGMRLDDPRWGSGGTGREPVLAEFPDPDPPKPVTGFETHAGANSFDFSRDDRFGFPGQAVVALFGDLAPVTTRRQVVPEGSRSSALIPTPEWWRISQSTRCRDRRRSCSTAASSGPAPASSARTAQRPAYDASALAGLIDELAAGTQARVSLTRTDAA